ncbi:LOW QUALITY PROTEIN: vacuolar protein sorting-associated protein 16 homolog [Penaeus indicus]|uniref:LOW QUALITY PROTEIN: vacuolar protein sorting-associated protein 16 homolog n=1 Tax=Penaeus indicus TaxID=29960 RepID=UPI00300C4665
MVVLSRRSPSHRKENGKREPTNQWRLGCSTVVVVGSTLNPRVWSHFRNGWNTSVLASTFPGIDKSNSFITPGLPGGCIVEMAVSNNSRHVALLSDTGKLWIGSSDIRIKYCEYDVKSQVKPKQIAWCGTGAVVLLWDMTLEVVNVNGDATSYYLDSASHLVQEPDGVRVLGSTAHDLLQKVPLVVTETLGIGSMAPGALLLEAAKGFQERSTTANDCLAMIKDTLEEAVNHCLQAAQHEYRPQTQKMLLRAALFGKSFLPEINPDPCKKAIFTLRVLNAVRDYRVGLPLTWNQLEHLTLPVLLDRLVFRRFFPLALQIASFLKMPESDGASRILAHWACYKVLQPSQKSDEQIAKEINSKLGYTPGISYTDIANRADQAGRKQLAIKLIEYECRAKEQVLVLMRLGEDQTALRRALQSGDTDLIYTVLHHLRQKLSSGDFLMFIRNFPVAQSLHIRSCRELDMEQLRDILVQEDDFNGQALLRIKEAYMSNLIEYECRAKEQVLVLMRLGEDQTALRRALQSGDTDLIYTVLHHLRQKLSSGDFLMFIRNFPVAQSLHIRSCRELDMEQLRDILVQEDDFNGQALLRIKEAYMSNRTDMRQASLQGAAELFRKAKNETACQMTEEQVKLVRWQVRLEDGQHKPYVNKSLYDTLHQLLIDGQIKEAEKLKTEFKIPERRYIFFMRYFIFSVPHFLAVITYFLELLLEEAVKVAQEQRSAMGLSEVLAACGSQHQALQTKIQPEPLRAEPDPRESSRLQTDDDLMRIRLLEGRKLSCNVTL